MPQTLGHILQGKPAGSDEAGGVGVAESMEGMTAEVNLAVLFKGPDVVGGHLTAVLSGADIGGVNVVRPPELCIALLPVFLLHKVIHEALTEADLPVAALSLRSVRGVPVLRFRDSN